MIFSFKHTNAGHVGDVVIVEKDVEELAVFDKTVLEVLDGYVIVLVSFVGMIVVLVVESVAVIVALVGMKNLFVDTVVDTKDS